MPITISRFDRDRGGFDAVEADGRRARQASYHRSSLRELPEAWRERGFERRGELFVVRPQLRRRRLS